MNVKLYFGANINFTLEQVKAIYDSIPVKEEGGIKDFKTSSSCAEMDAIEYFSEDWDNVIAEGDNTNAKLVDKIVYTDKNNDMRYAIPTPTKENAEVIMSLFGYLTYFATEVMINADTHCALVEKTSKEFPHLKESWFLGMLAKFENNTNRL